MKSKIVNGELVLTFPLADAANAPLSASGKNRVLFSSGGFLQVGNHRINLTVIPAKLTQAAAA